MPTVSLLVPIFGLLLCLIASAQLGLWAVQSLRINSQNNQQFELAKQLLRDQLRQQSARPPSHGASAGSAESNSLINSDAPAQRANPFRKLKVVRLVKETAVCTSVYLQPEDGKSCDDFSAGQHLPIRLNIPGQGKPVIRCYSLSNAAGEGFYRISVKAVSAPVKQPDLPHGLVSNFINQQLKAGDIVEAKSPAGSFTLQHNSDAPVVMLAGGIGITPMVSMIQEAINKNVRRPMILVYGTTNRSDQALREWIDQQVAAHDNIVLVSCFSSPSESDVQGVDYQVSGYVSIDLLKQILPGSNCQFYLCGPPPFMDSLSTGLADWQVPEEQVFSESFGPAARKPRPQTSPIESVGSQGAAAIRFSKSNISVNYDGQSSILELAEDAGVAIDSGCRAGSCESCLSKINRGKVTYPDGDAPSLGPQECLVCIAAPDGDLELDL